MQIKIDFCSQCDCKSKKPIVNKKYNLCAEKNKERLYNESGEKVKKNKTLKSISAKQSDRLIKIKEVYSQLRKEREQKCSSCNSSEITHSHIIPRSRRKDLEIHKENILYDCMKCHLIWEHGAYNEKLKLTNFTERVSFIKKVDTQYYNLLELKWRKEQS